MLNIIKCLRSGLVVSAITATSMGLSAGSVFAQEDDDKEDKEASSREVLVDCDKGQSVTETLVQFANDTKPLEIIIKGNCANNEDEVQIERRQVDLVGDEENPGTIPYMLVDGGRQVGIGDNLTLSGGLAIGDGSVEVVSETGDITINGGVFLGSQAKLAIYIEPSDDDEDSNGELVADEEASGGIITVSGQIWVTNHSLLEVQRGGADGTVILDGTKEFYDDIIVSLQSSIDVSNASVGNIYLERDSHAAFNGNVTAKDGYGGNTISCDSESRVWGDTSEYNNVGYCKGTPAY